MNSGLLGSSRKPRGIFEERSWTESLGKARIPFALWDMGFRWAIEENISEQPLVNTTPFLDHAHRLLQVGKPNEFIAWVYFRIEPDDENCTLLWIEVRRFQRVG